MIVLLMGVAGSGKTTVGKLLAEQLGWSFADADSYHSPENIQKMKAGIPLTDEDRAPWLRRLRDMIEHWIAAGESVVLACSALKESYRNILVKDPDVKVVFLSGSLNLIHARMASRVGHYMPMELLESQFAILEEPRTGMKVDVSGTPEQIVTEIRRRLEV